MDFFLSTTFDWIIVAVLAFCAVALISGHGDFILNAFRGKNSLQQESPYEPKLYSRVMGIICIVMLLAELVFIYGRNLAMWVVFAAIGVVFLSFVIGIWYLRKYGMKDDSKKK